MSKGQVSLLRWLARRGPGEEDGAHLHWDRRNRRWVAHEDAHVGTSPRQAGSGGRVRVGESTSRIR
jgi:hypothetical protein